MRKDETSNRKLKGYYKFSKKYPTVRGTTYAIGESRKMKKKERNNKILIVVSLIAVFIIAFIAASVCFNLSRRPIAGDNANGEKRLSADNIGTVRGIMLSNESIKTDADLELSLNNAVKNGMNAVVLDFKDKDGDLLYSSDLVNESAKGKNRISKETISKIHNENLMIIARVYCFEDSKSPQRLGAYVYSDTEKNTIWFDKAPALGGRVWLDPTNDKSVSYLCSVIKEIKELGADAIYLQSVKFPVSKTIQPVFDADINKNTVLTAFIESAVNAAGDCPIILGTDMAGIEGSDTARYGGSLFDTAAAACSPLMKKTDNYLADVEKEYIELKDRSANNFTTLNIIMTMYEISEDTDFYTKLSDSKIGSYIIVA